MPGWQQYLESHPQAGFEFLSVAADIGGAAAARPWHEAARARFRTVVDPANVLGRLFDYKMIPNGLF